MECFNYQKRNQLAIVLGGTQPPAIIQVIKFGVPWIQNMPLLKLMTSAEVKAYNFKTAVATYPGLYFQLTQADFLSGG